MALLLRHGLHLSEAAGGVEQAISAVLAGGLVREIGDRVAGLVLEARGAAREPV